MSVLKPNNPIWNKAFAIYSKTCAAAMVLVNGAGVEVISSINKSRLGFWIAISILIFAGITQLTSDKDE